MSEEQIKELREFLIEVHSYESLKGMPQYHMSVETVGRVIKTISFLQQQIEFLSKRENKLQQIEQMFQNGTVDLSELSKLVKDK